MENNVFNVDDYVIYESKDLENLVLKKGIVKEVYKDSLLIKFENKNKIIFLQDKNLYPLNYYSKIRQTNNFIKTVIVRALCKPTIEYVENSLDVFQDIVGGLIEIVMLDDKIDLLCNEEGKILSLTPNRKIGNDIIAGNFVLLSSNYEGEFISLNEEEITKCYNHFENIEIYTQKQLQECMFMSFIEL